jgi:ribonuclease Z
MELELTILGSNSAIPLVNRNPSSQFLTLASRHFLIDCGEGTQVQLRKNKIGFSRVNHIFISHLHGDHFFGLAPLLSTLHLLDRHKELHIYAPEDLESILDVQFRATNTWLRYPIVFHKLKPLVKDTLFEDKRVIVYSFPLKHSIDCWGFSFEEKERPANIKKEVLTQYNIPVVDIRKIKEGEDWVDENGKLIPNSELATQAKSPLSYAYCTDTSPLKTLNKYIQSVDLLYHESTFTEAHAKRAAQTKHSTAKQAASVANEVQSKHLLLGHFSTRYDDLNELLNEAKAEFKNTYIAKEATTFSLKSGEKELQIKSIS